MFLPCSREKSWHVHQGHDWNVEGVAKADKACGLSRSVDVEHAGKHRGLIGNDADAVSAQPRKSHNDILRETLVDLQKCPVVNYHVDDVPNVIRLRSIVRNDRIQCGVRTQPIVARRHEGRVFHVVLGKIGQQHADHVEQVRLALRGIVSDARSPGVNVGAAQLFKIHIFVRNGPYHVRTGDKHVG